MQEVNYQTTGRENRMLDRKHGYAPQQHSHVLNTLTKL